MEKIRGPPSGHEWSVVSRAFEVLLEFVKRPLPFDRRRESAPAVRAGRPHEVVETRRGVLDAVLGEDILGCKWIVKLDGCDAATHIRRHVTREATCHMFSD